MEILLVFAWELQKKNQYLLLWTHIECSKLPGTSGAGGSSTSQECLMSDLKGIILWMLTILPLIPQTLQTTFEHLSHCASFLLDLIPGRHAWEILLLSSAVILIWAVKVVFQDKGGCWDVCYIKRYFSCGLGLTKERLHTGISDILLIGEIKD